MTTKLRPIGALCPAAPDGALPRLGKAPVGIWAEIAAELTETVATHLSGPCMSVVLRGSTARETAVLGTSDIDMLFIVAEDVKIDHNLTSALQPNLKVEATELGAERLLTGKDTAWLRFNLAHAGWVFRGNDILRGLPTPRLSVQSAAHVLDYDRWLSSLDQHLSDAKDEDELRDICQWIMKRLVRSLFESVMLELNAYSRDIYPCAQAAAAAYPRHKELIWDAAALAVTPSAQVTAWRPVVDRLGRLLPTARARLFEFSKS